MHRKVRLQRSGVDLYSTGSPSKGCISSLLAGHAAVVIWCEIDLGWWHALFDSISIALMWQLSNFHDNFLYCVWCSIRIHIYHLSAARNRYFVWSVLGNSSWWTRGPWNRSIGEYRNTKYMRWETSLPDLTDWIPDRSDLGSGIGRKFDRFLLFTECAAHLDSIVTKIPCFRQNIGISREQREYRKAYPKCSLRSRRRS